MTRTQAFGYYAQNFVALNERIAEPDLIADPDLPRERLWQFRAREVVLATGAIERPLVFPDNDRPGVMLADAARRYCGQYGAKVGERVVVATAHDGAYRAALDLKAAGVDVVLDRRSARRGERTAAGGRARRGNRGRGRGGDRRRRRAASGQGRAPERRRRTADGRLRRAPDVGRLDAFGASLLAIARQARLRRGAADVQAGLVGAARAVGRRLQRDLRPCRRARRGRCGGARRGGRGRFRCAGRAGLRRDRRISGAGRRIRRSARRRRPPRQGVRRFPERRLRQGREPRGAGGHALDRAHQALHHDRHGDRPGQTLEHERARDRSRARWRSLSPRSA